MTRINDRIMNKKTSIAVVAARSGGHIIPGLTLAQQYNQENPSTSITLFTTHHPFDKKIITQHGHNIHAIFLPLDNIPARLYLYPKFAWQMLYSFFSSFYQLVRSRPNRIITMGGYISIPVALAAYVLRIPIDLYELNAVQGKATNLLAPLATSIHVCFRQAAKHFNAKKTVFTPYPVRFKATQISQEQAQKDLLLDPTKKTILILGGSQGSVFLNKAMQTCFTQDSKLDAHINIIHQTGSLDSTNWANFYRQRNIPAIVFDYCPDIEIYYQAADLIISRAGAGSIFETLFFKKACILVPLETSCNDHQLHNAQAIASEYPALFMRVRQEHLAANGSPLCDILHTKLI